MTRRRRLLAAALGIIAGLALAEVSLRLFWTPPSQQPQHHQLFCQYDPLYGWSKIPGFEGEKIAREYRIHERYNSKGLRGPEYGYDKPEGVYRILTVGDSMTEGYSVEFEETFQELLKHDLQAQLGRPVEVINAGTGGWSTDQEVLWFEREGVKYHPDLTLLLFLDNDILYNARDCYIIRSCKPRFALAANGSLTLTNVPPPRLRSPPEMATLPPTPLDRVKDLLVGRSYLAELVRDGVRLSAPLHQAALKLGLAHPIGAQGAVPMLDEFLVYRKEEPAEIAQAWRVTEALLARLRRDAEAAGSRLLVFYVPPQDGFYRDRWEARLACFRVDPAAWDGGLPLRRLREACVRQGIEMVDPALFPARRSRTNLYYRLDGHWTPAGHRAVADSLLAPLLDLR